MIAAAGPRIDVQRFREEGYLAVEGVLALEHELEPVVREYEELLDRLCAAAHAAGKIPKDFSDQPFVKRLASYLCAVGKDAYRAFDIALPQKSATEQTPMHVGPAVFNVLRSEGLLDAVEQLIGPEILSNPIQHVRIKPPEWMLAEAARTLPPNCATGPPGPTCGARPAPAWRRKAQSRRPTAGTAPSRSAPERRSRIGSAK
jgi:hypothetical protein